MIIRKLRAALISTNALITLLEMKLSLAAPRKPSRKLNLISRLLRRSTKYSKKKHSLTQLAIKRRELA